MGSDHRHGLCSRCDSEMRLDEIDCPSCGREAFLKYLDKGTGRANVPVLTHCPACRDYFPLNYKGSSQRYTHIQHHHGPEDFGLSPMGDWSAADPAPLYDDPMVADGGSSRGE